MEIDVQRAEGLVILRPVGRLDNVNGPLLEHTIWGLFDGGDAQLILDMSGISYISSAGLGVLLKSAKRARAEKGRIDLCSLQDSVTEVFEVSGFLQLFEVFESLEDARRRRRGDADADAS